MLKDIKYLVISDIHLGHNRNKTDSILKNLDNFFLKYQKDLLDIDILFIAGDVFDRLLTSKSIEYKTIMTWLSNLLLWCKNNSIKLRILYGTPSHDHDQISAFTEVAKKLEPTVDFKYVSILSIEHMKDLDLTILYVPDEWRHDSSKTYQEVLDLLKEHSLAQVDIAIMHGCFRYQIPMLDGMKFVHKESDYLDIVKFYITIGHVHTSSAYERILAPGSFDRLAHGEEEKKGGILCSISKDNKISFKFLENERACLYNTIDYLNLEEQEIVKDLKKRLKSYPIGSNIRLLVKNDNQLLKNLKSLILQYPGIDVKFKTEAIIEKKINIMETLVSGAFEINKNNINELLSKELEKYNFTTEELVIYQEELQSIL